MARRINAAAIAAVIALSALGAVPAQAATKCTPQPAEKKGPFPGRPGSTVADPVGGNLFGPNFWVQVGSPSDPYVAYYYQDGFVAVDGADASNGNLVVTAYAPYYYIIGAIEVRVVAGPGAAGYQPCVHRDEDRRNDPYRVIVAAAVPGSFAAGYATSDLFFDSGTEVTFANTDAFEHTLVHAPAPGQPQRFRSSLAGSGQTVAVAGTKDLSAGTYDFYCELHPSTMRGRFTVT
jgi:plastocyanin